ncbi:FAD-linked oxidase C-terminal domain-containing protein [Pseudonocardia xishanensis]|uniref:FAD-binding oxidoreductase/transferase type 4 C-terminal domain-containing protein n=1 Tax=Pseudonocardia xishanensis TaxID=630995 RepID=A0ABP8RRK9_9PSEU
MSSSGTPLTPAVAEMHRALRRALDPHGILNPGKVVPRTTS